MQHTPRRQMTPRRPVIFTPATGVVCSSCLEPVQLSYVCRPCVEREARITRHRLAIKARLNQLRLQDREAQRRELP